MTRLVNTQTNKRAMTVLRRFYQVRNRILKEIIQLPVLRVPSELGYIAALKEYSSELPVLSPHDSAMVDIVKREGILVTSLEELAIPSASLLIDAAQKLLPTIPTPLSNHTAEFVFHATHSQIMSYPEIFLWGLEERLLNIVENYIGLPVAYHGVYFRRDIVSSVQVKSRLWHTDIEDYRNFKAIVYLNDISDDGGPFQYIPKSLTSLLSSSLKHKSSHIKDEAVQTVIPVSFWKSCTGPSGTVILVDTANIFHRGKIPTKSDRFTLFFDYTSRRPKHPFYCKSSLSKDELFLLETRLSERQRECIFWRKNF